MHTLKGNIHGIEQIIQYLFQYLIFDIYSQSSFMVHLLFIKNKDILSLESSQRRGYTPTILRILILDVPSFSF